MKVIPLCAQIVAHYYSVTLLCVTGALFRYLVVEAEVHGKVGNKLPFSCVEAIICSIETRHLLFSA